jgi:hypothetical protein
LETRYTSLDISEIEYNSTSNSIRTTYHNKIDDLDENIIEFQGELIKFESDFEKIGNSNGSIHKAGVAFADGQIVPAILDMDWNSNGEFNINAKYEGLYSLEGNGKILSLDSYYFQITSPFNLKVETISKEDLINASLEGTDQLVTFQNLDDEFFYGLDSILEVTTNNDVNSDFLKNYFDFKEVSSNSYNLSPTLKSFSEETATMADAVLIEDKKYLIGSDYIQVNHSKVQEYKKTIDLMNLKTRSDVIKAVQNLVTDIIEYDYEMIDNDVTRILHLDDFLDKGKGVCQHFALLSTTLLRALGIPARIIVGYSLSPDQAGGHAWIEAKVTNDYWLPIEPQSKENYNIWTLDYYPLGVMSDYERGNPLMGNKANELKGFTSKYHFKGIEN